MYVGDDVLYGTTLKGSLGLLLCAIWGLRLVLLAEPLGLPNDHLVLTFSFPRKCLLFTVCTALFV